MRTRCSIHHHTLLVALLLPTWAWAQKEFPKAWETKFSVKAQYVAASPDLAFVVGGDLSAIEMLDGATGKSLWTYDFKEKHGLKKCDDWVARHNTRTVQVTLPQDKNSLLGSLHLDYLTGKPISTEELRDRLFTVAERRSTAFSGRRANRPSTVDAATKTSIELSYATPKVRNAMGGKDMEVTVKATGGHTWSTTIVAKVVAHLVHDQLPAEEGPMILDVSVSNNRVFVVYEGISCLDLATGKLLWSTTFDNTETSIGLSAKQIIGRAAMPLATADGVYVCDFSKGERTIKKLDPANGAVIWQADKLKKDDIVSEIFVEGGHLIARFGGLIREERFVPSTSGGVGDGVYKVEHVFEGTSSLRAYSTATGKPVWDTERLDLQDSFKKSECNVLMENGHLIACGEKTIFSIDPASGKVLASTAYNAKAIGNPRQLYRFNGNYLVQGDKGVALLDPALSLKYATNTGQCLLMELVGDALIIWTGSKPDERDEFIRLDPASGAILGKMQGCSWPRFDHTGDRFVRFDLPKVMMYTTR